jgi:methionyl-tRNA synthetase
LLEAIRLIGLLVSPVMPRAAVRLLGMLGLEEREPGPQLLKWGLLEPGSALGPVEPLFPRVESPGSARSKEKPVSETKPSPATDPKIDIADFAKLELKVARITAAEKIAGSKKLIKMEVDLGGESRQVVAGIAEAYDAESLPGKMVVVVANLKPAKLMGVESNGMLLAASVKGRPILCTFDEPVAPGAKIR